MKTTSYLQSRTAWAKNMIALNKLMHKSVIINDTYMPLFNQSIVVHKTIYIIKIYKNASINKRTWPTLFRMLDLHLLPFFWLILHYFREFYLAFWPQESPQHHNKKFVLSQPQGKDFGSNRVKVFTTTSSLVKPPKTRGSPRTDAGVLRCNPGKLNGLLQLHSINSFSG